jgi:hypothetical protein
MHHHFHRVEFHALGRSTLVKGSKVRKSLGGYRAVVVPQKIVVNRFLYRQGRGDHLVLRVNISADSHFPKIEPLLDLLEDGEHSGNGVNVMMGVQMGCGYAQRVQPLDLGTELGKNPLRQFCVDGNSANPFFTGELTLIIQNGLELLGAAHWAKFCHVQMGTEGAAREIANSLAGGLNAWAVGNHGG